MIYTSGDETAYMGTKKKTLTVLLFPQL